MRLEERINNSFFNRIRSSLAGKISAYSLATALTFGVGLSCGGGNGGGGKEESKPQIQYTLSDKTIEVDKTSLALQTISPDGVIYAYSYTGTPNLINSGDVLLGTQGEGYLRKAVSTQDLGGTLEVTTQQASMEEAYQSLSLNFNKVLTPDEAIGAPLRRGVSLETIESPIALGRFYVNMSNVVLYDNDNNLNTTNDQIVMNGNIDFSPEVNLEILIDWSGLKKLVWTPTLNESATVNIESKIPFLSYTNEVEIARYYFSPIPIGPVVITPMLNVNVGVNGNAEASITAGITQEARFTGESRFENGIWTSVSDFNNSFTYQMPALSLGAKVKGYAGPRLNLLLYGVMGPSLDTNGYLSLNVNPLAVPWWDLNGGLEANVGVQIDIFSLIKMGHNVKIIDYIIPLASACADSDNDGYGAIGTLLGSCSGSTTSEDCNDSNNTVYPNAPELCDLIDNQCPGDIGYGIIDEGCGLTGKIAFQSSRDGNHEIYVMNNDGSAQTNLTNNPADDRYPAWSPDGSKIAFYSWRDGNAEIYVMNSDGSAQTNLTNNPAHDYLPGWSPDGSKIAFASGRDGNAEIYVMNADGSAQTRLTNNPTQYYYPAWSPDGTKIAFDSSWDIYVMNADGSAQTRLTSNLGFNYNPAWSPDGTKIAFDSMRDGNAEIYVMNSDGSAQTNLTNNPASDSDPSWSPDGSKIAFDSMRDGNREIYIMNNDGSAQTRLTNNPAGDYYPAWSP